MPPNVYVAPLGLGSLGRLRPGLAAWADIGPPLWDSNLVGSRYPTSHRRVSDRSCLDHHLVGSSGGGRLWT